jgi:membrane protease YdiL (CAAX protease family)
MQQPDRSRSRPPWTAESAVPVHLLGVHLGVGFRPYLVGFVALCLLVVLGGYAAITLSDLFATFTGAERNSPMLRDLRNLLALGCAILFMQWVLSWQGRSLMSVIAPGRRLDGGMFLRSAATYAAAFAPIILISAYYGHIDAGALSFSLLLTLPVLMVLFIFQASAEEIVFRGYMAQGLQVLLGNAALAALPVALFFLVLHDSGNWNVGWEQKAMFLAMSLGLSYLT